MWFKLCLLFIFITLPARNLYATALPEDGAGAGRLSVGERGALTADEFNAAVDAIGWNFSPIVARHEARLIMDRYWSDATINLYAEQMSMTWFIHVYGGYALLPNMTKDAFQLSLCHELGHHLAGFPYKSAWSAAEGQADYFATHACLGRLWKNDEVVNSQFEARVDPVSKRRCDEVFGPGPQRSLCYRKATAALTLAGVFAAYSGTAPIDPGYSAFQPVSTTQYGHPTPQCRFETLVRGALCQKPFNWAKIPGKIPGQVVPVPSDATGSNALWAEKESALSVCVKGNPGEAAGARPDCWFSGRLR